MINALLTDLSYTGEVDSTKKQLEVLSRSSIDDASVEMEKKLSNLRLNFDQRIKQKELEHEEKVKRLVKEYETEKMKMEEKYQVSFVDIVFINLLKQIRCLLC